MTCPRCSAEAPAGARDCPSCGIIFAKWRAPAAPKSSAEEPPLTETESPATAVGRPAVIPRVILLRDPPPPPPPETLGITHPGWKAAALGFAMACALTFFPFLSFILHPLATLVHEVGHTVVLWLFGYPALPAFDFMNGGGVTTSDPRSPALVAAWVVGLVLLAWWQRERVGVLILLAGVAFVYFLMYDTRGESVAIAMGGHGGEIVFASVFLYRGLTGWGCKMEAERPLYAFVAFMILFSNIKLGSSLLGETMDKYWYLQGKGGVDHDLVTASTLMGWRLEGMARVLVASGILAIPISFVAASMRKSIGAVSEAEEVV